jgi:hypothetical protein
MCAAPLLVPIFEEDKHMLLKSLKEAAGALCQQKMTKKIKIKKYNKPTHLLALSLDCLLEYALSVSAYLRTYETHALTGVC